MIALGVSGPLVLSFIVFLCSFVPVIGVFISTLPMAVAALGDYGMSKVSNTLHRIVGLRTAAHCRTFLWAPPVRVYSGLFFWFPKYA